MLKKIKYVLLTLGAIAAVSSCKDFLVTPPVGSLSPDGFYDSPAHVEQGVLGVYSFLRDIELNQYLLLSEERSDNMWVDPLANGIRSCSEVSNFRFTSDMDDLNSLWASWYALINNANSVLQNSAETPFTDEALKNQYSGELYFLRGYAHFELARIFGNVPIVDHCLSVAESQELGQSTPAEVIAFAIADLKKAEELLPYENAMKDSQGAAIGGQGRADKVVAQAMLARAYMTLKGQPFNDASAKANAKTYLEKVLSYSASNGNKYWAPTIQEWKKQWLTDPSIANKYQIFSIQHTLNSGNGLTGSESGTSLTQEYLPKGGGGGAMTPAYIDCLLRYDYVKNEDPRGLGDYFMDGYKAYGATTTDYGNEGITVTLEDGTKVESFALSINTKYLPFLQKHEAVGMTFDYDQLGGWPVNFPVLRLEDIMLLYAEILAEDGDAAGALAQVNKIRQRAGIPDATGDALKAVKNERRLEFFLEGIRWFDEIRYGEWEASTRAHYARYAATHGEGVAEGNIKAGKYLCPIPNAQIKARPGLYKQNPDWE